MATHLTTANIILELDDTGVLVIVVETDDDIKREYIDLGYFKPDWLDTETERIQNRKVQVRLPIRAVRNE